MVSCAGHSSIARSTISVTTDILALDEISAEDTASLKHRSSASAHDNLREPAGVVEFAGHRPKTPRPLPRYRQHGYADKGRLRTYFDQMTEFPSTGHLSDAFTEVLHGNASRAKPQLLQVLLPASARQRPASLPTKEATSSSPDAVSSDSRTWRGRSKTGADGQPLAHSTCTTMTRCKPSSQRPPSRRDGSISSSTPRESTIPAPSLTANWRTGGPCSRPTSLRCWSAVRRPSASCARPEAPATLSPSPPMQVKVRAITFYGATKAAVNSICKVLRAELENEPIRAVTIMPGAVATNFGRHHPPEFVSGMLKSVGISTAFQAGDVLPDDVLEQLRARAIGHFRLTDGYCPSGSIRGNTTP